MDSAVIQGNMLQLPWCVLHKSDQQHKNMQWVLHAIRHRWLSQIFSNPSGQIAEKCSCQDQGLPGISYEYFERKYHLLSLDYNVLPPTCLPPAEKSVETYQEDYPPLKN